MGHAEAEDVTWPAQADSPEMGVGVGSIHYRLPCSEPFPLFQISVAEVQLPQEWEEAQPVCEGTDGCSGVGAQPLSTPCLACPGKFTD